MKTIASILLLASFLFAPCVLSFAESVTRTAVLSKPAAATASGLPKTGLTEATPYHAGDDGDPNMRWGNPVTPRFTADNANGIVTDNATGLMWEQKTNDSTIHNRLATYNWDNCFDVFLNGTGSPLGLNTAKFAGYDDWRIPNIFELQSILNYGAANPRIDPVFSTAPYGYTCSSVYWTSTTAYTFNQPWFVDFSGGGGTLTGGTTDHGPYTDLHYVRAVRGGSK